MSIVQYCLAFSPQMWSDCLRENQITLLIFGYSVIVVWCVDCYHQQTLARHCAVWRQQFNKLRSLSVVHISDCHWHPLISSNPALLIMVLLCVKGVMVRLMLVLAPVMCILSGIAVSSTLTSYMKNLDVSHKDKKSKKQDANYPVKNEVSRAVDCNFLLYILIC